MSMLKQCILANRAAELIFSERSLANTATLTASKATSGTCVYLLPYLVVCLSPTPPEHSCLLEKGLAKAPSHACAASVSASEITMCILSNL